eukprot:TRINITY_DN2902_c0_g1_i1.p1 TRINITY_DN2902_c0_g1~~TRINITY_DN2902_c0_g1_i1.p1  ORF type:complete len:175 (-),score=52.03 TRINITY_DN2902_c0_g1_i1:46-570(-)
MGFVDCLTIAFVSVLSTLVSEGISWVLIYRTDNYKKLKAAIDKSTKKLEKKKDPKNGPIDTKKIQREDEKLKNATQEMSAIKLKSTVAVAITMVSFLALLNSLFDGLAVAKLPFEPISLVRNISHRGLIGSDYTDCSMMFFYFLCSLSIRTNLQKIIGLTPPASAQPPNPWTAQ